MNMSKSIVDTAEITCVRCKRTYKAERFPIDMGTGLHRRICLLCFSRIPRRRKDIPLDELRFYESATTMRKRNAGARNYDEEFAKLESTGRCSVCDSVTELFTAPDNRRMCVKCEDRLFAERGAVEKEED